MGKFENDIPVYLSQLDASIEAHEHKAVQLEREITRLQQPEHNCDCEYCDEQNEVPYNAEELVEEMQPELDELVAELSQMKLTRGRLIRHANAYGVRIVESTPHKKLVRSLRGL